MACLDGRASVERHPVSVDVDMVVVLVVVLIHGHLVLLPHIVSRPLGSGQLLTQLGTQQFTIPLGCF